jgi:phage gpG-like protein
MVLKISLDSTQITKKLNQIVRDITDFSEPFQKTGDDLLKYYGDENFQKQGGATGDNWRELSAATLKMRANRTGYYRQTPIQTGKKLIWTGRLKKGFESVVAKTKLIIKNDVDYFKYHQLGSGRRPPQRKMLSISKKTIEIVIKRINEYALKIIKK